MVAINRVHINGSLASGQEEWSTSFACVTALGETVDDPQDLTQWATDAHAEFAAGTGWPGDLRSLIGVSSTVDNIRIYHYADLQANANAVGQSTGAAIAGSGSAAVPLPTSLVFTLQTARPGKSYRGRMYWPFLTQTIQSNGKINTSSVTLGSRATSFGQMLEAICAQSPLLGMVPMVASKTANAVTLVTSIRVGDVPDTQRRRRDNLVESFGTAAL